jgi:hypothetical protein
MLLWRYRLRHAVIAALFSGVLLSHAWAATGPAPVILVQPSNQSVPILGSARFEITASSGTTMSYQWRKGSAYISGATSSAYTIASVQSSDAADYSVKVVNSGGTVYSSNATLTVLVPPGITTQPVSQSLAVGQAATFSVVASGTAPLIYQWSLNGMALIDATNSTLTLTNLRMIDAGTYTVAVTNSVGAVNSSAANLKVLIGWVGVVTNLNDSGAGSLRQALMDASVNAGPCHIVFNIPGSGPFTISVLSPLPVISNPVIIDGTTQPGFTSLPMVEVNGKSCTGDGLSITASGCTIKGLAINQFSGCGILLTQGSNNVVQGNFLGSSLDGSRKLPNGLHGVKILNSAGNVVGGAAALSRNVVMASGQNGIQLEGAGASYNQVLGNYIGLNWTGSGMAGVGGSGIVVSNAAWNVIGGPAPGAGNLSSCHRGDGLVISGPSACFNMVQGNWIGTDITGTNSAGTTGNGITIWNAPSNTVGGLTLAAANVIVANSLNGIAISGGAAQFNVVQGNFIGTDRSGTLSMFNAQSGVFSTNTFNNLIGGLVPGAGNTIAFNKVSGVVVGAGQCAILGNSLFSNSGGPQISLLSGGNSNAVAPLVTSVMNNGTATRFQGTLVSTPSTTFRIEFFASPTSAGHGKTFLGAASLTTDSTGAGGVSAVLLTGNITNQFVTATATDPAGNTSQFSIAMPVAFYGGPLITADPQSVVVGQGQSAVFVVSAAGATPLSYQWWFNGSNLAGATSAALTLTNLQSFHAGNYSVVVTNTYGSVTSAVATLTVTNFTIVLARTGSPVMTPGGFTFPLSLPAGRSFIIEASTNLRDWAPIATNLALTGSVIFTDPAAANYPQRFYRAMVQ